jgi:hypothetical protein
MNCVSFLRHIGLLPPRRATDDDLASASTENALRDNATAFAEMHEAYSKVPETSERLRETIRRSTTPFADLEKLMHGENRKRATH